MSKEACSSTAHIVALKAPNEGNLKRKDPMQAFIV